MLVPPGMATALVKPIDSPLGRYMKDDKDHTLNKLSQNIGSINFLK